MNTYANQIKGNTDLLEQCEKFRLFESKDGFITYHGFGYDDEVIELVFVNLKGFYHVIDGFSIINMLKKDSNIKLFVNYAIM